MKVNTKTWLKLALILVSGLCLYLFLRNDAFLYQQPIGKVVAVKQATPEKRPMCIIIAMRRPARR